MPQKALQAAEARMQEFVVDLTNAATFEAVVAAFNEGFCRHFGAHHEATLSHGALLSIRPMAGR